MLRITQYLCVSETRSDWEGSKGIAKMILRDRVARRKYLGRFLGFTLLWMATGLWVIDGWLGDSVLLFLIWWGFCALLAMILVIFAVYDALSVVRDERSER
jgi:hypothetical protein